MSISYLLLAAVLPFQLGGESQTLFQLEAVQPTPGMGTALAPFGDFDADGLGDYLVGARGKALVVSGDQGQTLLTLEQPSLPSFGSVLRRAGDIDGDGTEDILVGAPLASPSGRTEAGSAFLYSGATGQLLHEWHGATPYGFLGKALSPMTDFDADGTPDLAVGAPEAGPQDRGKVFLYSGATGLTIHTLEGTAYDSFGAGLALAEDLDFDGIADLVVGAPNHEDPGVSWGAMFLYSGADGHLIRRIAGPCTGCSSLTSRFGADPVLADDMDGDGIQEIVVGLSDANWAGWVEQGLVHVYSGATGTQLHNLGGFHDHHLFGSAVASVGDIDLDGKGDFAVLSANSLDGYLYSGNGTLLDTFTVGAFLMQAITGTEDLNGDTIPDFVAGAPTTNQVVTFSGATGDELYRMERVSSYNFGSSMALLGDVNGDGHADIAVGDPDGGNFAGQGAVILYSGDDASVLHVLQGPEADSGSGTALLGLGDLNSDGAADVLVGAPGTVSSAAQVLAYSGADGSVLFSHAGPVGSRFGQSLAPLSDLNGDGIAEYLVGAPQVDAVMIHSGADGSFLWQLNGPRADASFGSRVASADVDQDGLLDLIIGAPLDEPWSPNWRSGSIHVHAGLDGTELFVKHGPRNDDAYLGLAVANAGDVDGDGVDDIVAGAPYESTGFSEEGAVYVWSGATSALLHRWEGQDQDMYTGNAVSTAGDLDRDGYADLLLGSDAQGFLLYSGATGKLLHRNGGGSTQHRLGKAVTSLGDLNGDGSPDFGVGAPYQAGHGVTGTAYVFDFTPFLSTDSYDLSLANGGHLNLSLDFQDGFAFREYKVLVSTTGVGPSVYGITIPLTADATARASFLGNYPFPTHSGLQGSLNAQGEATASIDLPAGMPSQLLGLQFWLAAVALTPGQIPEASSVAIPFRLGP